MLVSNQRPLPCEGSGIACCRFLEIAKLPQIAGFVSCRFSQRFRRSTWVAARLLHSRYLHAFLLRGVVRVRPSCAPRGTFDVWGTVALYLPTTSVPRCSNYLCPDDEVLPAAATYGRVEAPPYGTSPSAYATASSGVIARPSAHAASHAVSSTRARAAAV